MIDEKTKAMILEALNDEYKARALYRLVIKAFGPVRPFINIVEAEDAHATALEALCARYGILPPHQMIGKRSCSPPPRCSKPVGLVSKENMKTSRCTKDFCVKRRSRRVGPSFSGCKPGHEMLIFPRSNGVWHAAGKRGEGKVKARLLRK